MDGNFAGARIETDNCVTASTNQASPVLFRPLQRIQMARNYRGQAKREKKAAASKEGKMKCDKRRAIQSALNNSFSRAVCASANNEGDT